VREVDVANFLAEGAKGRSAQTLSQQRAAVAHAVLLRTGQRWGGEGVLLRSLIRGAQKREPITPRKKWPGFDLDQVLKVIESEMGDNTKLTDHELVGKAAFLLLTAGWRVGDMIGLDRARCVLEADTPGHAVRLVGLTKENRQTRWTETVLANPSRQQETCLHCALVEYGKRWPPITRVGYVGSAGARRRPFFVHLRHVRRQHLFATPMSGDWLRKLVRKVLDLAKIPIIFRAHSVRAAAATKALSLGVPLALVHKIFRWSAKTNTCQNHYLRPSIDSIGDVLGLLWAPSQRRDDTKLIAAGTPHDEALQAEGSEGVCE